MQPTCEFSNDRNVDSMPFMRTLGGKTQFLKTSGKGRMRLEKLRTDSLSLLGSAVIAAKSIWIPKGSTSFLASSFVQSQRIISERRVRLVVGVSALGEDSVRSSFPAKTDLRKWSSGSVRSEKYCLARSRSLGKDMDGTSYRRR